MIEIKEAKKGDCLYAKMPFQNAPLFGEIIRVFEDQQAVEITTKDWGFRIVWYDNAYWEEKDAKRAKYNEVVIKKENPDIIKDIKGDINEDTKQDIDGECELHHREPIKRKSKRAKKSN